MFMATDWLETSLALREQRKDFEDSLALGRGLCDDAEWVLNYTDMLRTLGLNGQALEILRYQGAVEAITGRPLPTIDQFNFTSSEECQTQAMESMVDMIVAFFKAIWRFLVDLYRKLSDFLSTWRRKQKQSEDLSARGLHMYRENQKRQAHTDSPPISPDGVMQEPWASQTKLTIFNRMTGAVVTNLCEDAIVTINTSLDLYNSHKADPREASRQMTIHEDIEETLQLFGNKPDGTWGESRMPTPIAQTIAESSWTMPDLEALNKELTSLNQNFALCEARLKAANQEMIDLAAKFDRESKDKNLDPEEQKIRMRQMNAVRFINTALNTLLVRLATSLEYLAGTRAICIAEFVNVQTRYSKSQHK